MRVLLDTHTFLWASASDRRLSARARELLEDASNSVYLSVASAWEIAIKYAHGRMPELTEPPESFVARRMTEYSLDTIEITMDHAFCVAHLPAIHRDPFDRILVAQAQVEGLPIVTDDPNIARYDVEVIW